MAGNILTKCATRVAVLGIALFFAVDLEAAVSYRKVIMLGEPAPGADPGYVFSTTSYRYQLTINDLGQVAFKGQIHDPDQPRTLLGIWSEGSGSLAEVVLEGDQLPGQISFGGYDPDSHAVVINNSGAVALSSSLDRVSLDDVEGGGIWIDRAGSLRAVAVEGGGFGLPPTDRLDMYSPVLNDLGHMAFMSIMPTFDDSNDEAILLIGPDVLLAQEGDPAPGAGDDVFFGNFLDPFQVNPPNSTFSASTPIVMNNADQAAFFGRLKGTGVDSTNDTGIWFSRHNALTLIARAGDPAPGAEPGVVFSKTGDFNGFYHQGEMTINNAGQIAFEATLTGPGVIPNETGIWLADQDSTELVAREHHPAPGTEPGVVFSFFWSVPQLGGEGTVVFPANVAGPGIDVTNNTGYWYYRNGSLEKIVKERDPVPGMGPGVEFIDIESLAINESDQIIFFASMRGPSVDDLLTRGLWEVGETGSLRPIIKQGDVIDINEDPAIEDLRTISGLSPAGPSNSPGDGQSTYFNSAGQVALSLNFTDGSTGFFVATIPEPGTACLFALSAAWGIHRRRSAC